MSQETRCPLEAGKSKEIFSLEPPARSSPAFVTFGYKGVCKIESFNWVLLLPEGQGR